MRETPRSQGTASDARSALPRLRSGRALAHNTGASGSGNPHRSDVRPPHTPRGARDTGQRGRLGTTPPVPRRPTLFPGSVPGPRRFSPLSVGLLCALFFAAITWQVADHGPLRTLDERLGRTVAAGGIGIPSGLAEFFADLGNTVVALPVLAVVLVWAGWRGWRGRQGWHGRQGQRGEKGDRGADDGGTSVRWWVPSLAAGLALAVVPALVVPLKLWLARPGPPQMAGGAHDGFYPSGHGATAAVAYGVAALLLTRGRRGTRADRPATGALTLTVAAGVVLLNVGVGIGLVRRGYHWPLDVLGSWCLAGVLLAVWCAVCDGWSGARGSRGGNRRQ
ncbi:phosphatase PAP2 family protein [Streptomyces inhibens]|nr:phosphatase PAP2 family protein [Streptomyces inhibens]UKY52974.1 phosphatase PAP2 family protein [Streptomyces inhibens]